MENTAPRPVQQFGDARGFDLSLVSKATSGYQFGTRLVLKSFPKDNIDLKPTDMKTAPDRLSAIIGQVIYAVFWFGRRSTDDVRPKNGLFQLSLDITSTMDLLYFEL